MKKITLAILLILAMATTSIFAVTDSFSVTTTVAELGLIKVTKTAIGSSTLAAYNALVDYDELTVTAAGSQTFTAYMTTLSNKRTGYNVKLSATAMTSTVGAATSYINYTVTTNGVSVTTNGAAVITPATVITVASLTAISGDSKLITLSVDPTTFNAAVSGTYVGNVTFTFTAT
ncbi:MAG: hypothetical protein EOM68_11300 [Spirochaetia bacterium]|nr:hypothetical protein [Spirochaetia bacterium]